MTELKLDPQKQLSAMLHLLLENNINIKAHNTLMIEIMTEGKDYNHDIAIKRLAELKVDTKEFMVTQLNILYGKTDLSDLLGDQ